MNLFDEVFDSDANIYGVILSHKEYKNNTFYVLWKNEHIGFIDSDEAAIKPTGRNFADIPLKDLADSISENNHPVISNGIDWGEPKGKEIW
ncbi:hypothetical protein NXH64_14810 [Butyrivibrio fibrisolvens]|uniref:hypothetical protein n=1 Tax=Pseudobutyrivibrio ruminis TaxID=46206 RepID=UPI00041033E4|nr:hypothetical protein [Pseudobutyrivibrio ruminis]MDC7280770.1 hypothetical protein [Butyrivibrio fibrisolvens]